MKLAVIGAGPAGLIAAGSAACKDITIFERNEKAGKKLYITGKGRCNVTNDCTEEEFLSKIVSNPKFLFSAINAFTPSDTIALLEKYKVPVKTERGKRVFPLSDKSSDVSRALEKYALDNGAKIEFNILIEKIDKKESGGFVLFSKDRIFECDKLIIAAGGASYPLTGSDGAGFKLSNNLGHTLIAPKPALVPIMLSENVSQLTGLSLKNVEASIIGQGFKKSLFGEMLFTAAGVSGPVILTLSSYINNVNLKGAYLSIDLKPALTKETLDERILSDFEKNKNKQLKNSLGELMPKALIPYVIRQSSVPEYLFVNAITKAQRTALVDALKDLKFDIRSLGPIEAGIVTAGGVDTKEINPKTMESKLVKGLFFAGEVIDVDACTGGFNIQTALSTGYLAGKNAWK